MYVGVFAGRRATAWRDAEQLSPLRGTALGEYLWHFLYELYRDKDRAKYDH